MIEFLALLLGLLTFYAAGYAVARSIDSSLASSRVGILGIALICGPGIVAFASFLLDVAHVPFSPLHSYLVSIAFLALAVLVARRQIGLAPSQFSATTELGPFLPKLAWTALFLCVALGALFAMVTPAIKDSLVNWSYKTLVLFQDGSVRTEDLRAEFRHLYHPNYPLLVPIAQVFLFGLAGTAIDQLAKVTFALPHLGVALLAIAEFRARLGAGRALLIAALLATTPHFYRADDLYRFAGSVPSGYADPTFAALSGACAIATIAWLRTRRRGDLAIAALFLGLAVFTKNESLPFAIAWACGIAVALMLGLRSGRPLPDWKTLAAAAAMIAAIAVPWFAVRSTLPERDENYQHSLTLTNLLEGAWRIPLILVQSFQMAFSSDFYGFVWPVLLFALIAYVRRLLVPEVAFAFTTLAAMATVYAAVFIVTPLPIVDSLVTSIPRTFFQMSPLAVVLLGTLLCETRAREP